MSLPRILVVTSCTGEKLFKPKNQLKIEDFKDREILKEKSQLLSQYSRPAGEMYKGLQHLRVMEGVNILRSCLGKESVDVKIVSAGYGIISEEEVIVPYSVTFNDMKSDEISSWADFLKIHENFQQVMIEYDLIFVLLGDKYLRALKLPVKTQANKTLIFLAAKNSRKYIKLDNCKSFIWTLDNADASRFSCALVGLKGQLLRLIVTEITLDNDLLVNLYNNPETLEQILNKSIPLYKKSRGARLQKLELPLSIPCTSKNISTNAKKE
ncbi:MAG: hypothetical protein QNJ51_09535 [Calothrix sp. MO_167.B12]|nr:hypothetical protein [Calothrix sp. MO_167.B12]